MITIICPSTCFVLVPYSLSLGKCLDVISFDKTAGIKLITWLSICFVLVPRTSTKPVLG